MKWLVRFNQEQRNCCPPGAYQRARQVVVEADTAEQAQQQVLTEWRYNHKIKIKDVVELKEDNE